MKRSIVSGLLAALVISSCQVAELEKLDSADKQPAITFSATMEALEDDSMSETKTSMDSEGNVLWKSGDQVSIFVGSTINEHFRVSDASDGKTTASLVQVESSGFVAGGRDNPLMTYAPDLLAIAAVAAYG